MNKLIMKLLLSFMKYSHWHRNHISLRAPPVCYSRSIPAHRSPPGCIPPHGLPQGSRSVHGYIFAEPFLSFPTRDVEPVFCYRAIGQQVFLELLESQVLGKHRLMPHPEHVVNMVHQKAVRQALDVVKPPVIYHRLLHQRILQQCLPFLLYSVKLSHQSFSSIPARQQDNRKYDNPLLHSTRFISFIRYSISSSLLYPH